jgi:nucleotide-binding universal stress UspA family protein
MEVEIKTRILVATDGTPDSRGALRLAMHLARTAGVGVDVLLVAEPAVAREAATEVDPHAADRAVAWSEPVRARLSRQLAALGPGADGWVRLIGFGSSGPSIARVAAERNASLILLGLRRGASFPEPLRGETTMRVVHSSDVPVLAVHPEAAGLPRRVLVALDFDDSSLDAARAILPLLGGRAALHLAHVALEVSTAQPGMLQQWETTYLTGAATRLEELARDLEEGGNLAVSTHVAAGDPESKLLELAEELHADLITVGSHDDFLRGGDSCSVALALIRGATCSVLVAPAEVPTGRSEAPSRLTPLPRTRPCTNATGVSTR